jgi:hypothetical protein
MTADFVLTLSRLPADKVSHTARFNVAKNRFGPDGICLPARMNTSNGQIELFDATSQKGIEIQSTMSNEDVDVKAVIRNKWNNVKKKTNGF